MKMNPEIKAKWVAALRSGDYPQGRGVLRNDTGFCCLGVLADIQGCQVSDIVDADNCRQFSIEDRHYDVSLPEGYCGLSEAMQDDLSSRNDGIGGIERQTFAQIADHIEANL